MEALRSDGHGGGGKEKMESGWCLGGGERESNREREREELKEEEE